MRRKTRLDHSLFVRIVTMCMSIFVLKVCTVGFPSVRGGLSQFSLYWRDTLNASKFVQSIVQNGGGTFYD